MKKLLFFCSILLLLALPASANKFSGAQNHPNVVHKMLLEAVPDPPQVVGGTAHSVTLTWVAPNLTGVSCTLTSYNVKRGATAGSEVTISSPTTTTYVDTAVTSGTKYFYVVTAVYSNCSESGPSNEVSATIPLDQGPAPGSLVGSPK